MHVCSKLKLEIKNFNKILNDDLYFYNSILFKRKCKITFRDIFYYLCNIIFSKDRSSVSVASQMNVDKITDAKHDAFKKKRKIIPSYIFDSLSNTLVKYYYDNFKHLYHNKYRILSVDGTYVQLSKDLNEEGYELTKNNTYVKTVVSGLYDNTNNLILDFCMNNTNSESQLYKQQFKYLKKNDIVMHDRGYYSYNLLYQLNELNVFPIFRLKIDNLCVKELNKNRISEGIFKIDYNNQTINYNDKIIKYRNTKKKRIKW